MVRLGVLRHADTDAMPPLLFATLMRHDYRRAIRHAFQRAVDAFRRYFL